jgi:hypothetical protein
MEHNWDDNILRVENKIYVKQIRKSLLVEQCGAETGQVTICDGEAEEWAPTERVHIISKGTQRICVFNKHKWLFIYYTPIKVSVLMKTDLVSSFQ